MTDDIPGVDPFGRMSRKAVAQVTGYSAGTLANWAVSGGKGPPVHYDGARKPFYLADEVRAFALGEGTNARPMAA